MGCRGYCVWRHKGRYLSQYEHWDSDPSNLGVKIWESLHKSPDGAEQWLQDTRTWVEEQMEMVKTGELDDHWDEHEDIPPMYTLDIVWLYEVDLDNCVFHVNEIPVFNLLHMPPTERAFLDLQEGEDRNMIGSYMYIPDKNRWDSALPRLALPVDAAILDEYTASNPSIVKDIVPPPSEDTTLQVRQRFAEIFISEMYRAKSFVSAAFKTHASRDLEDMSDQLCHTLDFLNRATLWPPVVATSDYIDNCDMPLANLWNDLRKYTWTWSSRTCWVRKNVCVYSHPHLTDEANLRAGVVYLLRAIAEDSPSEGIVYGVLNSVTHCALLSYNPKTRSVAHTLGLPLLPSWGQVGNAECATPGIAALASLCKHLDDADGGHPNLHAPKTVDIGRLPFDVLVHIADYITESETLLCFAAASSEFKQAAKSRLMLPILNGDLVEKVCEDKPADGQHPWPGRVYCADRRVESLLSMWCSPGSRYRSTFDSVLELFSPHVN